MDKKETTQLLYYKNGVDYAHTFYTTATKLETSGMLKSLMGLNKIPNKKKTQDFNLFLGKAKMNARNLCIRDLNENSIKNPEDELNAFMVGFEETLVDLLNKK